MTHDIVPYSVKRVFAIGISFAFVLAGLLILLPFTEEFFVDPTSPNTANIIISVGWLFLVSGGRMLIVFVPFPISEEQRDAANALTLVLGVWFIFAILFAIVSAMSA